MGQHHNPKIVTDGLMFDLDTLGGRGPNKIITKPTQVSDCILWLDADDAETVVTSGANITNWLDKSGKGNHAEDHGATEYPQYDSSRINGRKVVNFVPNDVLKGAFASGSQPFSGSGTTIISVIRQNTWGAYEYMAWLECMQGSYLSGSYGNRIVHNVYGSGYSGGGSANNVRLAGGSGSTNWPVSIEDGAAVIGIYTNDSSTTKTYFNGEFIGNHGEDKGDDARTYYCLGDDATSGDHFNGYICEIIIYNKVLSDDERQQIELYLSRKWNIALQTSHREQTSPSIIQSSSLPVSGFKNGKLDQVGNSMYFMGGPNTTGGYKDYINCGQVLGNGGSYYSGDPFTYEVWAKDHGSETSWKTLIGSSSYAQIFFYGNSNIRFGKNGGNPGGSHMLTHAGQLHEWYHIAAVWVGGIHHGFSGDISTGPYRRILYVNGEEVDKDKEVFYGGNINDNYIGSYHSAGYERAPVELAVARIYNRDLTHEEIKQNYNAQSARIAAIPKIPKPGNLKGYWDAGMFESYKGSGSGATWYDLSGNGNDGAMGNDPTYDTALPENDMGKFFAFDGVNDYFSLSSSDDYNFTSSNFSVAVWFRRAASDNGYLVKRGGWGSSGWYVYSTSGGAFQLYTNDDGEADPHRAVNSTNMSNNVWYHGVAVRDGTSGITYLNGEDATSSTEVMIDPKSASGTQMQASATTNYFQGDIAVIMIFDTALSAKEVKQLYDYHKHRYGK